jgi:hypothetical protein
MIKIGYTTIKKLCAKVRYFIGKTGPIADPEATKQLK